MKVQGPKKVFFIWLRESMQFRFTLRKKWIRLPLFESETIQIADLMHHNMVPHPVSLYPISQCQSFVYIYMGRTWACIRVFGQSSQSPSPKVNVWKKNQQLTKILGLGEIPKSESRKILIPNLKRALCHLSFGWLMYSIRARNLVQKWKTWRCKSSTLLTLVWKWSLRTATKSPKSKNSDPVSYN